MFDIIKCMRKITDKQQKVLDFVMRYISGHGYPPSVRDIAGYFKLSVSTVFAHIEALRRKGAILKGAYKSRAISLGRIYDKTHFDVMKKLKVLNLPIVGTIRAGAPILAEENIEGTIDVPKEMVSIDSSFILKVKGDSMKDVGILEGDFVIVRSQESAEHNDIVVVFIEDEATVKRFVKKGKRFYLKPENPKYNIMFFTKDMKIIGKVTGLVRMRM